MHLDQALVLNIICRVLHNRAFNFILNLIIRKQVILVEIKVNHVDLVFCGVTANRKEEVISIRDESLNYLNLRSI